MAVSIFTSYIAASFLLARVAIGSEVCYGDYGCFSTKGAFDDNERRPFEYLPQDPSQLLVTFCYFSNRNKDQMTKITYDHLGKIDETDFRSDRQTKIIVHGLFDTIYDKDSWTMEMKNALLLTGNYNVFLVDWSRGNGLPYSQAASNVRIVGAVMANLMKHLQKHKSAKWSDFHVIGHSLGAHAAGYVSSHLPHPTKIGQITGLDPADPEFQDMPPVVRLDPSDADFVDVIHTDGDSFVSGLLQFKGGFGASQSMGHVDFYPNGGNKQPGCNPAGDFFGNIVKHGLITGPRKTFGCDHERSFHLYTASIVHRKTADFVAYECENYERYLLGFCLSCDNNQCAYMGIRAKEWNKGNRENVRMYLVTKDKYPYFMHQMYIRLHISDYNYPGLPNFLKSKYGDVFVRIADTVGELGEWSKVLDSEDIKPSHLIPRLFTTSTDISRVTYVQLKWIDQRKGLSKHPQSIYIRAVEIGVGITGFRATLDAENAELVTDKSLLSMVVRKSCNNDPCRKQPNTVMIRYNGSVRLSVCLYLLFSGALSNVVYLKINFRHVNTAA